MFVTTVFLLKCGFSFSANTQRKYNTGLLCQTLKYEDHLPVSTLFINKIFEIPKILRWPTRGAKCAQLFVDFRTPVIAAYHINRGVTQSFYDLRFFFFIYYYCLSSSLAGTGIK